MIGDHGRREKSRRLDPTVAVGRTHHGYLDTLVPQSGDAPCPLALDQTVAFELEPELDKLVDVLSSGWSAATTGDDICQRTSWSEPDVETVRTACRAGAEKLIRADRSIMCS
jgi:hypothetical protein